MWQLLIDCLIDLLILVDKHLRLDLNLLSFLLLEKTIPSDTGNKTIIYNKSEANTRVQLIGKELREYVPFECIFERYIFPQPDIGPTCN